MQHTNTGSSTKLPSVGIIGAGVMGTSIAAVTAKHELPVVITDVDEQALANLPARATALIEDSGFSDAQSRQAVV